MLDSPIALFHRIRGARAHLVFGVFAQFFFNCPRVGGQPIGGDLFWCILVKTDGLGKEGLGSSHITRLTEADIHQIAILINTPVEVAPHSFYSDKGLIHQPDFPDFALSLCPYLVGKMRQKPFLPIPHGFMCKLEASEQEAFGHIPIAKFVTHAAKQNLEDDVCRDFNEVEGAIRPLIEGSATHLTPKHVVTQTGFTLQRRNTD